MSDIVIKTHLRAIKRRLLSINENLEGIDYWSKNDEPGVVELEKKDIQNSYSIIQNHLEYLSDKF